MENRKRGWSGFALKLLAVISMLLDHTGAALIETGALHAYDYGRLSGILETEAGMRWYQIDMLLRFAGRIAFPIFCLLLVEGFLHTRDVRRYARNLLLFALISEVPFDLAFFNTVFYRGAQNVYFTLFFGVLLMMLLKRFEGSRLKQAAVTLAVCVAAQALRTDYGYLGILLIAVIYLFRHDRRRQLTAAGIMAALESIGMLGAAALAILPISRYNGERGKWKLKYVFYWFYPVHILVLFLIRYLIMGVSLV